jgi:transcriptional regulator with XRE-family HTH domain
MKNGSKARKRLRPRRPNRGAQLLRRWLERRGCTQSRFAQDHGVSTLTVSMWCTGRMVPSVRRALWLRDLCNVPIEAWWQPEKNGPGKADARFATGTDG